jgi:hypothetical protein
MLGFDDREDGMSSSIEEQIIETLRGLPFEKQEELLRFAETLASGTQPHRLSILEELDAIVNEVPPEAWDEVPTDGSINADHYLYGAPKRK